MKLRKLALVLIISACVVKVQIMPAFALNVAEVEESELMGGEVAEQAVAEPEVLAEDTAQPEPEMGAESEAEEDSEAVQEPEQKPDDAAGDSQEPAEAEETKPEAEAEAKTEEKAEESKAEETSSEKTANPDKKEPAAEKPESPSVSSREKDVLDFQPSSKFIDNREKIKYNIEVPIDGIPSFITSEMIVGTLKCQDEKGYPASVTIAQIIQESGYGMYGPGGEEGKGLSYLAYQYNNLFGIKGKGPAGSVNMRTGEQTVDGESYMTSAGFRVYNTYTECIEDRSKVLDEVYRDLTYGVEDANTFAMKVGSRWATDIDYGQTLIRVMEKYDLYRLDEMTVGEYSKLLGTFVNPCPGSVLSSGFGKRVAPMSGASTYHKGIDLGTGSHNLPTYAAAEGVVIETKYTSVGGNMIAIDHGNGLVTKYLHHDKIYVKAGDKVEKGQQIGLTGTTGISTGNHLHFQVERNGVAVNPFDYLEVELSK